ncbi:MAG: glycosyltransferase [Bacteriovorax sp.]|jgi:glycosyltransferase involved in cell wall biosynthesis|nr:glycosyltransferase [Bacteriovorax sp.]
MKIRKANISVCVLAHNEERSIERTLMALMNTDQGAFFPITVYANGCSDRTHQIVSSLAVKYKNIRSREIPIASKVNAWNTAFEEQDSEIVVFCDGDVFPEKNAVTQLQNDLLKFEDVIISSSRLFPSWKGGNIEQRLVAFMQLPLGHEYLSGGLYAVKRDRLKEKFNQFGFAGIPKGITGEDYFLERLIEPHELYISTCKNFYMAPIIKDYIRYLARIRWQNEQMALILGDHRDVQLSPGELLSRKLIGQKSFLYLFISIPAVILRFFFKKFFVTKIEAAYKQLGPVVKDGEQILTSQTRSHSTK